MIGYKCMITKEEFFNIEEVNRVNCNNEIYGISDEQELEINSSNPDWCIGFIGSGFETELLEEVKTQVSGFGGDNQSMYTVDLAMNIYKELGLEKLDNNFEECVTFITEFVEKFFNNRYRALVDTISRKHNGSITTFHTNSNSIKMIEDVAHE